MQARRQTLGGPLELQWSGIGKEGRHQMRMFIRFTARLVYLVADFEYPEFAAVFRVLDAAAVDAGLQGGAEQCLSRGKRGEHCAALLDAKSEGALLIHAHERLIRDLGV